MTSAAVHHRIRRRVRLLGGIAALLTVFALLAGWTATAGAQGGEPLQIRKVDTTDSSRSTVQFLSTADPRAVAGAVLSDNGVDVSGSAPTILAANEKVAVALVFDTSSGMDDSGALVSAKDAARAWINGRSAAEAANQRVGIFTASDVANRVQDFTSDTTRILSAIDRVAPPAKELANEKTALWSAIQQAGDGLAAMREFQPNIVVMTASSDTVGGSRTTANGAVTNSGASVFAVELLGPNFTGSSLNQMVTDNGGLAYKTETGTDVGALVEQVSHAIQDQQYTMTFAPDTKLGSVADLTLQVGDATASAAVTIGSAVTGATALDPTVTTSSGGISILQGSLGMILLVVVVAVAGIGLAYGVIMIFVREDRLATALRPTTRRSGREPTRALPRRAWSIPPWSSARCRSPSTWPSNVAS
jgi:hypothetical protein